MSVKQIIKNDCLLLFKNRNTFFFINHQLTNDFILSNIT